MKGVDFMEKYTVDEIKAMAAEIRKQLEEECAGVTPAVRPMAQQSAVVAREEAIAAIARLQKEESILCDLRATVIRAEEASRDAFSTIMEYFSNPPRSIEELYKIATDKSFQMGRFAEALSRKCDGYMEHIKTAKAILYHFIYLAEMREVVPKEWQKEMLYWYNLCITVTAFCDAALTYSRFIIACEKCDYKHIEELKSSATKSIPSDLLEEELQLLNLTKVKNAEEEQARLRLNQLGEALGVCPSYQQNI